MRGTPKNVVRFLGTPTRPYLDVRRCGQRATHASPSRFPLCRAVARQLTFQSGSAAQARWRAVSCVGRSRSNSFAHARKASAACWISCSLRARSSRCSTSSRASTPGRASCSRNSAIASATERMVRPSRMWSSRWNRSLAGFLMHALTSDRHFGSGWSAVQQAPQYLPLSGDFQGEVYGADFSAIAEPPWPVVGSPSCVAPNPRRDASR
jgi:hypothetical protein